MTNEELLSVAEIVERATNRFNAQAAYHRERFDEHVKLIASMKADHEAKMVEHRAAFGARTEADAKIIAGLREELEGVGKGEGIRKSAERLVQERDALRAEVAELKTQLERLTSWAAKNQAARETLQNEIEKLKSQTPKQHPVKVGDWVKASNGAVAQVLEVHKDWYLISRGHGWTFANCEPCDQPATHDTDAGKAAAESALKTEPVADEIKVGDVAKVVGASGDLTAQSDIGKIGEVLKIDFGDGTVLLSGAGWVNRCDVRKVTT